LVNWKDVGGADAPIEFRSPGSGSLANFLTWVYGKTTPELEAKMKAVTAYWATKSGMAAAIGDGHGVLGAFSGYYRPGESKARKLAIMTPGGAVDPTPENIRSGRYPMSFNLQLITNGHPQGVAKNAIDFLLTDQGQARIEKEGFARIPASPQK
jgi:phosphate transport system substrate-binding protein